MFKILRKIVVFASVIMSNYCPNVKETFLGKKIFGPIWRNIRGLIILKTTNNLELKLKRTDARIFFESNAERVKQVTELFCDKESKKTFLGMIDFRQTSEKRNYVYHGSHTQYFINDFFTYGKNEVLIDCGAFTGDTIEKFLKLPNLEYEQIIAFEPNAENYKALESKFAGKDGFMLINAGAYNKNGELYFSGSGGRGKVSEIPTGAKDETSIKVRTIDNLENLKKVTFIKMDIEGAEMDALDGAKKTILRDKPRLAICIYHSNEDMLRIAEWVHALVPEYKLYCRQHTCWPYGTETVLYARLEIDYENLNHK